MCSYHHDGKKFQHKRSKTVVYKCKKKRRYERSEEGKTLVAKSLRYILQDYLYCLLANIFIPKFQRRKIIPVNINFFSDNLFFLLDRSSQRRCSVEKDVLRNFAKFTGKHSWQNLFFKEETLA